MSNNHPPTDDHCPLGTLVTLCNESSLPACIKIPNLHGYVAVQLLSSPAAHGRFGRCKEGLTGLTGSAPLPASVLGSAGISGRVFASSVAPGVHTTPAPPFTGVLGRETDDGGLLIGLPGPNADSVGDIGPADLFLRPSEVMLSARVKYEWAPPLLPERDCE